MESASTLTARGRPLRSRMRPRWPATRNDACCWRAARRWREGARTTWRSTMRAWRAPQLSSHTARRARSLPRETPWRAPGPAARTDSSSSRGSGLRFALEEVLGETLPQPAVRFVSGHGLGQHDGRDLLIPGRPEAETALGHPLEAIRGPEGGGDGLEAFVVRFQDGNVTVQLQDVVADACCVGHGGDVCEEREHDERCDRESDEDGRTSPPTPGRLLPSWPPQLPGEHRGPRSGHLV